MPPPTKAPQGNGLGDDGQGTTRSAIGPTAAPETQGGKEAHQWMGRVLSHYRLEEPLGEGGMGVVYRATDLKLGRAVAIKLLARQLAGDEGAKARFLREARAASALDHPNIGVIYEVGDDGGELFIAMALYEGQTLKQRLQKGALALEEALPILREVSLGMQAAHAAGIVHRDIKPANLMLTSSGTVKILDFGLAKLVSDSAAQAMSRAGEAMGTVLYMSPEQLRGAPVDARSDLWSLGVVAHEMLAGVSPFQTDSSAATAIRILGEEPASLAAVPGVPDPVAQLVSELLRKNPAERPQTAAEVHRRLEGRAEGSEARATKRSSSSLRGSRRWAVLAGLAVVSALGTGGYFLWREGARSSSQSAAAPPSIAVLPFADLSQRKDQEYFSDGIAEEILDALAQIEGLRVAGRTSSFSFKGKGEDLRSIGQKLNVGHVLEGSVRKDGNHVRITAQLVNARDGFHLWSQSYDRELADIFAVQEQIARAVVEALRVKLLAGQSPSSKNHRTDDLEAYRLYLLGKQHHQENNEASGRRAREELEKAITLDPHYGPAWASLSVLYYDLEGYAKTASEVADLNRRAMEAARKAVDVAPELAEAWSSRAFRKMDSQDWQGAHDDMAHALALNPRDPVSNRRLASLQAISGRSQDAIATMRSILEVDPLAPSGWRWLARFHMAEGQVVEAQSALERSLDLAASSAESWREKGWLALMQRRPADALVAARGATESDRLVITAVAEHELGRLDGSRRALEALTAAYGDTQAFAIAEAYAWLGERDAAFRWLERAYAQHDGDLFVVRMHPALQRLRGDPRWHAFLRKMNLPVD